MAPDEQRWPKDRRADGSLRSYAVALDWAGGHLEALHTEMQRVVDLQRKDTATPVEGDPSRNRVVITLDPPGEPASHFSMLVATVAHALRVSLDYLVYDLSVARAQRRGKLLSQAVIEGSQFPLLYRPSWEAKSWPTVAGNHLAGLSDVAKKAVKALQPGNTRPSYKADPLWRLNEIDRGAKHRLPPVVAFQQDGVAYNRSPPGVGEFVLIGPAGKIEQRTEVADFTMSGHPFHFNMDPGYEIVVPMQLRLTDGPLVGADTLALLVEAYNDIISRVLPTLRSHL